MQATQPVLTACEPSLKVNWSREQTTLGDHRSRTFLFYRLESEFDQTPQAHDMPISAVITILTNSSLGLGMFSSAFHDSYATLPKLLSKNRQYRCLSSAEREVRAPMANSTPSKYVHPVTSLNSDGATSRTSHLSNPPMFKLFEL